MTGLHALIQRNCKLFFKDKGTVFTSLITPLILLVLYVTFLGKVYHDSICASIPKAIEISEKLINAAVGGQLFSSLLAVSCVTVAFCSNMIMVVDKGNGSLKDLRMTAVKKSTLAIGYYISTVISTVIIALFGVGVCFIYLARVGWYLSLCDVLCILLDVLLLVLFGTALSSIINIYISTQGQISAVGTVISAGYGFICGAYMPISQFGSGVQKIISFLPGTYGTSLLRNHALRGVFSEMSKQKVPEEIISGLKEGVDCNLYFFNHRVPLSTMYIILAGSVVLLLVIYIILNALKSRKKH